MFFKENGQYRCAVYLRLSRSDGDQQESNSIKNQRALLNDYLGKHPELYKVDEYVDDGYSGTNFERPDFKRMMQDIEKRNVNCIIVKDLSRFGRNYIETGRYLERIFPFMGIRFIAINDHYDSAEENDDKGRILIPFNNLINDTYCRDISMRVRSHLDVKRKEGQFIGSFAGYGYQKVQCKRKKGTTPCSYHTVPEKMLMMVAMKQIHHLVSTMCEEEKMVKEMLNNGGLDSTRSIKVKENSIAFRIQETEERRLRLYEDYKAEILDEEEYSRLKEHYIAEKQRLEHELQKQRQRSLELEKRMRICDEQMERMRAILNQKEFDEELVHELIKKIYVGIDNSVEIEFKCSDPYQEVLAFVAEVQNE